MKPRDEEAGPHPAVVRASAAPHLAFSTISELGAAFRTDRVSPIEVTRICLDRIAFLDADLNAFLLVLENQALARAAMAERELRDGQDRGPLHGVPVAVKDLIDIEGVPTSFGAAPVFTTTPSKDAPVIQRLRNAGAIIVGKTNLDEFAYGTVNSAVGQTNNPWDLRRTAGGSSGGSAAAVAAGLCYAAIGTDTGGRSESRPPIAESWV